ncbi:MAG TPA: hypothetical protein PJ994_06715 [Tepidiformaceae bacterium]|nr:hypothetical protein [Tepidiformaceae bacterium]
MTLASLEAPRAMAALLPPLVCAAGGLIIAGARHPGRPLCISRRSGRVTVR